MYLKKSYKLILFNIHLIEFIELNIFFFWNILLFL
jgi:hypothetical protein